MMMRQPLKWKFLNTDLFNYEKDFCIYHPFPGNHHRFRGRIQS